MKTKFNSILVAYVCILVSFLFALTACEKDDDKTNSGNGSSKSIKVTSPNGGENWESGSQQSIKWTFQGSISEVAIKLFKGGVENQALNVSVLSGTDGNGQYLWSIPGSLLEGDDYVIRISDANDASVFDVSDANFSIVSGAEPIDGAVWGMMADNCPWGPRGLFKALVFNDKIWILPGYKHDYNGQEYKTDVWNSSDGINWTQVTSSLPFGNRNYYSAAVFNNKMWIMGGRGDENSGWATYNDVWSSSDGVTWTQETNNAGWSKRHGHESVVFNNKLWVISEDAWSSTNGVSWTQEATFTGGSSTSNHRFHSCVVFDNKIWKIAGQVGSSGTRQKYVIYSTDGKVWVQATADPGWQGRHAHVSIVADNKIWTMGGNTANCDDVWYSENGSTWIQATANAGWGCREFFSGIYFNNKLWIFGGADITWFGSDVWTTQ